MVEGMQYGGSISLRWRIFSTVCHTISMEDVHHQCSGGYAVWTCHIINTEEGVQYTTAKTAEGVVGGCIYLENDILQTR